MAEETNTNITQTQQSVQGDKSTEQNTQQPAAEPEKKFTQEDLDAAVEKRLARERRRWEREQQRQPAAPQSTLQPVAGAEPATKQPDPPVKPTDDTAERLVKANARQVQMAARLAAVELGVPASRAEYAARMADLSKVDVDEVDGPDADAVKKAIGRVLKDIPELKGATRPSDDGKNQQPGIKIGADNSGQKPTAGTQPAAPTATRVKPWNKFRTF